ncbi:acyl-CoA dehydrogenase family protein [Actinoplanes sp. HUAS TT8]|uniref:acyl-CoA dehydrogenase family protein n=1 Tax=Actinoplanes sp. HUAS TT8 TaxID=3447453 RepID=UPI003F5214A1
MTAVDNGRPTRRQPETLEEALVRIRAVLAELARDAATRDLLGGHPYELVQALADAGFGRLRVPADHGGFDVSLPELFELLAEAGQADSNIPQIWRGHFTTIEILRQEADDTVRSTWLRAIGAGAVFGNAQSEPAAFAASEQDPAGWGGTRTRVRADARGTRVVSGEKFYSTGARFADYIRAAVLDESGNRIFVVVSARHPKVTHVDDWDGIGQRQTGSGTTIFDDVPVEPLGDVGRYRESLRGLDSFVQIVHLANLAGIARSLVTETVDLVRARARTSLHALSPDATQDPEVLGVVGTLHARRLTADSLLRHAAERLEAAHRSGAEADYTRAYQDTSAAQVAVIEAVLDAATTAFNAGGSSTVRNGVHLDRHWRNARTLASHNPVVYKPRIVGDYLVNAITPVPGYYRDRPSTGDS